MRIRLTCCIILALLSQPLLGQRVIFSPNKSGSNAATAFIGDGQAPQRAVAPRGRNAVSAPVPAAYSAATVEELAGSTDYVDSGAGACCGSTGWCRSPLFATVDAIFLDRDNDSFTQPLVIDVDSGNTALSTANLDFDYEPGVRATIGLRRPACRTCSAWELTYLGVFNWDASLAVRGDNDLAVPGDLGFVVNGFTLAESIRTDYSSKVHSVEANCIRCISEHCCCDCYRRIDWIAGLRYLKLDEDLTLLGNNQDVAAAIYNVDTDNNLYGPQIGARMRTYRGRWGWELMSKVGVFGNDASERQYIVDELGANDFVHRTASASGGNVAFVSELSLSWLARLSGASGLRCGYNLLWVEGIALAPDHLDFSDTPRSGTVLQDGGGNVLHGFNVGFELGW